MGLGDLIYWRGRDRAFESGGRWYGKGQQMHLCCKHCGKHENNHKVKFAIGQGEILVCRKK